jgi:hypothetical protein
MKLTILLLFITTFSFAQDPILGSWNFAMNKKIDVDCIVEQANSHGFNFTEENKNFVFATIATAIIARCEYSDIFFNDFDNTVMMRTVNSFDSTIEKHRFGKWERNGDQYLIIFEGGQKEYYRLNRDNGEIYLDSAKYQTNLIAKMLATNLKMIRGK